MAHLNFAISSTNATKRHEIDSKLPSPTPVNLLLLFLFFSIMCFFP